MPVVPGVGPEKSLPPREAWIEMKPYLTHLLENGRRFPHGKRGLKFPRHVHPPAGYASLPPREAWIEIPISTVAARVASVASPTGSVD